MDNFLFFVNYKLHLRNENDFLLTFFNAELKCESDKIVTTISASVSWCCVTELLLIKTVSVLLSRKKSFAFR